MKTRPVRLRAGVVLAVVATLPLAWPAGSARADELSSAVRELSDVETAAMQLRQLPLTSAQLRSATHVEERLTDGELFYRLRDYVRASVILSDVVDNYPNHNAYPDALFLLGESLFQAGDFLGARARYRLILDHADEGRYRRHLQGALGRLIEIAIRIRDFDGIERYFERLAKLPPSEVEAATAYFRAKYLYSIVVPAEAWSDPNTPAPSVDAAKLDVARSAFEAVAERSPYYPQARYYIGVIYTLRGQYSQALDAFGRVLQVPPSTDAQREILDLARLARGRLYYETKQLDLAIEAYQAVPRTSSRFDVALYEIAWVYIRQGDSTRAERALEVLAVAAPQSQYIPDAKLLRGNLLLREGRYDDASVAFNGVIAEFQPVREQLDQLVAEQEDPHAFFRQLVRDNLNEFDAEAFLPPLARRWAVLEGDMERALDAVADFSQARKLSEETSNIVVRLQGALRTTNRVNIFPDLRRHRERTVALRNRLAHVRQALIREEERLAKQFNSAELTTVRARRRELERALAGLPLKDTDFAKRDEQADSGFGKLGRQLAEIDVAIQGLDARIVATDWYVDETMTTPEAQAGAAAIKAELLTQRQAVADYRDQLVKLRMDLEAGRIQVGVGDGSYQRDEQAREEHRQLIARERQLVAALGGCSTSQIDTLYQRADSAEALVLAHDKAVDAVVEQRAQDMQKVLGEESVKLDDYRARIAALDADTVDVVGGIAHANYRQVQQRFYDLVLRADVGAVDVGWALREMHRIRIEGLTRERARTLQSLDDEYREIMDERGSK
jgi:tetratricopeptide (TPR) repeat protein